MEDNNTARNNTAPSAIAARVLMIAILAAAIVATVVSGLRLPTVRVSDSSMAPTYNDGDVLLCFKSREYKRGDVIAFRMDDRVFVKRITAVYGQWVDFDGDGNVYVNNRSVTEPYASNIGGSPITAKLPCQVPEGHVFVLSDDRSQGDDSRSASVGCVALDDIAGKIVLRLRKAG